MKNQIKVEIYNGAGYEFYNFNSHLEASLFINQRLVEAEKRLIEEGKTFTTHYELPYVYIKGRSNVIHFQMRVPQ